MTAAVSLKGDTGANELTGGTGNDTIDGGAGDNTLILSGARADYSYVVSGSTITVIDNRAGSPDGTDTVHNIEHFQFADELASRSDLGLCAISSVAFGTHDGTLKAGDVVDILVTFTDPVNVSANGAPTLTLSNGATATFVEGSGTNTLKFRYTVASGEDKSDITVGSYNFTIPGTPVEYLVKDLETIRS